MAHSVSNSSISATSIQPRFKDCSYDDNKSQTFRSWLRQIGGIVNNVNHGIFLERWLDIYLGRETERVHTRPGFLSDPDLMIQPAAQAERYFSSPERDPEQSFEVETAETDEHAAAGDGQSLRASTISALDSITRKYSSLPQEAQDLDVILFSIQPTMRHSRQLACASDRFVLHLVRSCSRWAVQPGNL